MIVDIGIRCFNQLEYTKRCIGSIMENTKNIPYTIFVVDNGSTDGTREWLDEVALAANAEGAGRMHVIHNEKNLGSVTAINQIILSTSHEFLLIMDNDTEIIRGDHNWLRRMVAHMTHGVGAVGAVSDNVSGFQNVTSSFTGNEFVPYLISFCWLLNKYAIDQTGLLDEQFNPGNSEDIDYSFQLIKNGWTLKIAKDVFIKHYCSRTFKANFDYDVLVKENIKKLSQKWGQGVLERAVRMST